MHNVPDQHQAFNLKLKPRYEALDGLRGIAAIGVMLFHLSIIGVSISHHGYLAVDFFFILSGFVLSHAYTERFSSMKFSVFFRQRLIRIIPLSLFGLFAGSSYFLIRYITQNESLYGFTDIIISTAFNAFLIPKPWITDAPTDTIFPSNTPLWSLSLEVFINFIWALFLLRSRSTLIIFICLNSGFILSILIALHGSADIGATWPTYIGGLARVTFGFFMGVVLWRYRPEPIRSGFYTLAAVVCLALILMSPDLGPAFDIFAIMVGFPAIILAATCSNYGSERLAFRFLGEISYPLYTIHVPILMYSAGITKLLKLESSIYVISILSVAVILAASLLLDRLYDRPVRRFLSKQLGL